MNMRYDLVQYGCDICGKLTDVLDVDQKLPKGWWMVSRLTHICPQCSERVEIENAEFVREKIEKEFNLK